MRLADTQPSRTLDGRVLPTKLLLCSVVGGAVCHLLDDETLTSVDSGYGVRAGNGWGPPLVDGDRRLNGKSFKLAVASALYQRQALTHVLHAAMHVFIRAWISVTVYILVALIWFVSDWRIEMRARP